jgi:hypothetical protein
MLLWARTSWSLAYLPKVLAGLGAVGANVYCYSCVEKRTAEREDFRRHSQLLFQATMFGLCCFVIAVVLGGKFAGWWG